MNFGKRILILVPHPDDEVVACAATIGRAIAQGSEIFTLYLTHGCIPQESMWPWTRHQYSLQVACRLGEGREAADILGVTPIDWSTRPARYLWRELPKVYEEIRNAVAQYEIDQIWVPTYEGGNPDHDALNALGSLFKKTVSVIEFAEYNFFGGKTHSQEFVLNGSEEVILLSPEEIAKKRLALGAYQSEKSNLSYVRTERESFRPLMDYDYSRPPHEGTLWYGRFQWVPFRHPRVDFSKPEEVSGAIVDFLYPVSSTG